MLQIQRLTGLQLLQAYTLISVTGLSLVRAYRLQVLRLTKAYQLSYVTGDRFTVLQAYTLYRLTDL